MKINTYSVITALVGFAPFTAYSQKYEVTSNATFALTKTIAAPSLIAKEADGTFKKDENNKTYLTDENIFSTERGTVITATEEQGTKLVTVKYSNKEILTELVEAKIIPMITGYSIAFITHPQVNGDSEDIGLYVVKKGLAPLKINNISFGFKSKSVENSSKRIINVSNSATDDADIITKTGSLSGREEMFINFSDNIIVNGTHSFSETWRMYVDGAAKEWIWVPNAGKITGLVGGYTQGGSEALMEGSFTYSSGVVKVLPNP